MKPHIVTVTMQGDVKRQGGCRVYDVRLYTMKPHIVWVWVIMDMVHGSWNLFGFGLRFARYSSSCVSYW